MKDPPWLERLPGYELYKEGKETLGRGEYRSAPAQLLLMAKTRLRNAGLEIEAPHQDEPAHLMFYRLLADAHPDAHAMYNAYLQRLDKFCRAVERERLKS